MSLMLSTIFLCRFPQFIPLFTVFPFTPEMESKVLNGLLSVVSKDVVNLGVKFKNN
jgi:hypothetical protein